MQLTQNTCHSGTGAPATLHAYSLHMLDSLDCQEELVPWICPFIHFSLDRVSSRPQPLIFTVMKELGAPIPEAGSD